MPPVTVDDLRMVVALNDLPDEHLQWIIDHSEYAEYEDRTQIKKTGEAADVMIIIIEGKINFYFDYSGRLVYYFYYANDESTGGVGGLFPYSRMKFYPGSSFAAGHVRCLKLHKQHFAELEAINPDLIQRLTGYMTERAKLVATTQSHHEKVNALGQLAAGIAHELNNPAAAVSSITNELSRKFEANYGLTSKLLEHNLSPKHIQQLYDLVKTKRNTTFQNVRRSALQRMQDEDKLTNWLEEKGMFETAAAETFLDAGFSIADLQGLFDRMEPVAFIVAVSWLENLLSSHKIIRDLNEASSRISFIVNSIKGHVHMDRSNDLQPTNIHEGIEDTLTLLGYKLREKNIEVVRKFCSNMKPVKAYVAELNEVWRNLIDNAVYAMDNGGKLTIETRYHNDTVTIVISDNGTGIPKEIQSRIFDPFFTTKKVGEGTGIGLDIVSRAVKHHRGEIKVNSVAGYTTFVVSLPSAQD